MPVHPAGRLVVATWNLANLGLQERRDSDYALIADIVSWFDLVAVQEVRDDLRGLRAIQQHLSATWKALFTDRSGNDERLAFLYRSDRVRPRELIGEISLLPHERKRVVLPGSPLVFTEFERSPFLCSFEARGLRFTLGNVHIYFGEGRGEKFQRRCLEVLAVATYAKLRQVDASRYDEHLMLIGDFNTPAADEQDPVFAGLLQAGLVPPDKLPGTAVGGRTMGFHNAYDQLVMFPSTKQAARATKGVFDFDSVLFPALWSDTDKAQQTRFFGYLRYYLSDHRVLWAAFDT